jgi:hypothetical protein
MPALRERLYGVDRKPLGLRRGRGDVIGEFPSLHPSLPPTIELGFDPVRQLLRIT